MKKPKILVVLGPTATGKSDLAVQLAITFSGEIISADSRQVYIGLDIGTGKITKKEMRGIPHHLLDITSPKKIFSVSEWQFLAKKAIEEILSRGKLPILCGGTGFYIQSVVENRVLPEVPPNTKLRKQLEKKSAQEMYFILQRIDPERAKNIEAKNPVRLIRAIEIATALGSVPPVTRQKNQYDILQIGLMLEEIQLKSRIHTRILSRIQSGMIDEAKRLHVQGLSWKRMRELGLEYRHLADMLQNVSKQTFCKKISKNEKGVEEKFTENLERDSWRYARRQMTWFKRDKKIKWFSPHSSVEIEKEVRDFLIKKIKKNKTLETFSELN